MVGHIAVPSIDPTLTPTSLSPALTDSLLKRELGFEGIIYTDALSMRGAKVEDPLNNACLALLAGCDVMESSRNPVGDLNYILEKVRTGEISERIIEEKCRKVLKYKYLLGLNDMRPIEIEGLYEHLNSPQAEEINRRLSQSAITVIKNNDEILPIDRFKQQAVAVVSIGNEKENDSYKKFYDIPQSDFYYEINRDKVSEILNHDIVVVNISEPSSKDYPNLDLLKKADNLILVFCVNPYKLKEFASLINSAKAVILTYDDTPLLQEYAAKVITGLSDAHGKLPVTIESIATIGEGLTLKAY